MQTPNLAKFAEEGMTFVNWYSAWHCCSGSRSAMMTGRLPPRVGVDSVGGGVFTASAAGGLPLNETTFAEVLKGTGYRTGMLGKCYQHLPNLQYDHHLRTRAFATWPRASLTRSAVLCSRLRGL